MIYARIFTKKSSATTQLRKFSSFCKYILGVKFEVDPKMKIKEFYTSHKDFASEEANKEYYLDKLENGNWDFLKEKSVFLGSDKNLVQEIQLNLADNEEKKIAPTKTLKRKRTKVKQRDPLSFNPDAEVSSTANFLPEIKCGTSIMY